MFVKQKYVFQCSLISQNIKMNSSKILVTGLPNSTTTHDLMIYFQSERDSAGSDVKDVGLKGIQSGQAIITFENAEAAAKVVQKGNHYIKEREVLVALLPELYGTDFESDGRAELDDFRVASSSWIETPHQDQKREVTDVQFSATPSLQPPMQQCTVKVMDLPTESTEDVLTNYFENARRSKGGPVSNVVIDPEHHSCLITFENPEDAIRTAEHSPHRFGNLCLDVSLLTDDSFSNAVDESERRETTEDTEVRIIARGILPSKEALEDYFENQRRSGGGKVVSIEYTEDGGAVVTFAEVKDLKRLLEGSHFHGGNHITVERLPPKRKVPLDPVSVHVRGLNTTGKDNVRNYLEKFCDQDVTEVLFGCNSNALVFFEAEPDFTSLFDKVHKDSKGLSGCKLQLERVSICNCIKVKGLKKEAKDVTIELYFDNERRSSGGNVSGVERIAEDEALVYFQDSASATKVIRQSTCHTVGDLELEVKPYYPFLEEAVGNKSLISCDPDVFRFVHLNHESQLQALQEENRIELSFDDATSIATVCSTDKKKDSYHSWQERTGSLESFIQSFKKASSETIDSEIFDEVVERWGNQHSIQSPRNVQVSFDCNKRIALIIGQNTSVEKEMNILRELVDEIKEDTELMKSIVEVPYDGIPKSRLTLLQMSGICDRLQTQYAHLSISFEENGQKLCLKGPRIILQDVRPELLAFTSKVIEHTIPLSPKIISVLKRSHVSDFVGGLLKKRNIQALVVYDESKTSNEPQMVGIDSKSVEEATMLLQEAFQERSLNLTNENAVVLKSSSWKDFQSEMTSKFKVGIFTECQSNTVCVSGITEDVKECFDVVKIFLDANTILHNSLPMDQATTRFIVQKWDSKLEEIKRDHANCFLEMKTASNYGGIEISGTAEGLEKCLPRLQELVKSVQKTSVPVEHPAIKAFILDGKGPEILKSMEERLECVIVVKERKETETLSTEAQPSKSGEHGMPSSPSALVSCRDATRASKKSPTLIGEDIEVNQAQKQELSVNTKMFPGLPAFGYPTSLKTTWMNETAGSSAGIRITVKSGDLSKEKADVLVGTAAANLNLDYNPCAKALKETAGDILQQECNNKRSVHAGDIAVVNKTGKLECKVVIFAICSGWNGGKGKEVLKGLVTKCLEEADSRLMTSIAFAAIGTGNLQFPPDQVAEAYFDEVRSYQQKHPNTSVKDVRFVLFDNASLIAFRAAESRRQNSAPSSSSAGRGAAVLSSPSDGNVASLKSPSKLAFSLLKEEIPDHLETTVGALSFQVQPGDITNETTEAIAVISNPELDISGSEAGAAIITAGGFNIKTECSKNAPRPPGSIFVSTAGNLAANYLYHIVPNQLRITPESLQASVLNCLQEADRKGISSISFPAIGTGNLSISTKSCTSAVLSAILEMSKQNPVSLTLIKMVIFQRRMIKDVRSVMIDACGMKTVEEHGSVRKKFGKLKQVVGSVLGRGGKEGKTISESLELTQGVDCKKVDLLIFAGSQSNLQKARDALEKMMTENRRQQDITDEAIMSLTEDDMKGIRSLQQRYSVEINVNKEQGCIVVDGLSEGISQVVVEICQILRLVGMRCHSEIVSNEVQWRYKTEGHFKDYESHVNTEIELAYYQKKPSITVVRDEEKYKIIFDGMFEEDKNGVTNEVQRIYFNKDVAFPSYWAPQLHNPYTGQEEHVCLFHVDPKADVEEYKKVSDQFQKSCKHLHILKIERVQNPALYKTYTINKQRMDKTGAKGSNELCLFHGTKGPNCKLINDKGFNRSFFGENGAAFGNGVYFAAKASYSARSQYSQPDSNGYKHMYLARVLVGDYTVGKRGLLTPPAKDPNNLTDTYDSVVDDVSAPSIFVVFYDWQCYPEYLITFQ